MDSAIPVEFIFVEAANLQMELGYATFSYPEPVLHAVNRAWRGSRGTRMGCAATADQNLASEQEQNTVPLASNSRLRYLAFSWFSELYLAQNDFWS
jgi:hypothetical protein